MDRSLKDFVENFAEEQSKHIKKPDRPWPSHLESPPWRIPHDHPHAESINKILKKFIDLQRSKCPGTPFKHILTHCSFITSGLMLNYLKSYFTCVPNDDIEIKFVCGLVDRNRLHNDSSFAHSWLEMNGHIIEVTYSDKDDPDYETFDLDTLSKELYFKYREDDPLMKCHRRLDDPNNQSLNEDFKQRSKTDDLIEKHLVYDIYKGLRGQVLDRVMRKYLLDEFNVEVVDLRKKWSEQCWTCFKKLPDLKICSGCRTAKYCGRECQRIDRKEHKKYDKTKRRIEEHSKTLGL